MTFHTDDNQPTTELTTFAEQPQQYGGDEDVNQEPQTPLSPTETAPLDTDLKSDTQQNQSQGQTSTELVAYIDDETPKQQSEIKKASYNYDLTIAFRHANVLLRLPLQPTPLPNMFTPIKQLASSAVALVTGAESRRDFYRVKNISGCIKPGTMTLVVSPPGHGKSSYLKLLATQITKTSGTMTFNGVPIEEVKNQGADLRKMISYQEQTDIHLSLLNVYETIEFACQMGSVHGNDPERINGIISSLGLDECKATLIGDEMVKGVSGGQKRRVSTAVAMATDAPCLVLDEYSNGLDSSVTEKITQYFADWTKANNTSVIATLQQPTPSVFALFDHIVLLREGEVVFDGPREDTLPYLESMGFKCRDDVDACDFVVDVLSQPRQALYNLKVSELREKQLASKKKSKHTKSTNTNGQSSSTKSNQEIENEQLLALQQSNKQFRPGNHPTIATSLGQLRCSPTPCLSTHEMVEFFYTTPFWKKLDDEISQSIRVERAPDETGHIDYGEAGVNIDFPLKHNQLLLDEGAKQRFSEGFRLPFLDTIKYSIQRQKKVVVRNKSLLFTKWMNSAIVGLLIAALFYQLPHDNPTLVISAILLSMSQPIYNNMVELSTVNNDKKIIMRELQASMYPGISYVVSSFISALPFALIESLAFTLIFYFMEGFYLGAGEFFTFWYLLVLTTIASWSWFRFCATLMGDLPRSLVLASPTISYMNTFAGFYISRVDIHKWLIWAYYFSPYSWLITAFANSQFNSPAYDKIVINALTGNPDRLGNANLDYVSIYQGQIWILYCSLYILVFTSVMLVIQSLLLRRTPPEPSIGTRRVKDVGDDDNLDFNTLDAQFALVAQKEEEQEEKMKKMTSKILHSQHEHASKVASQYGHNSRSSAFHQGSKVRSTQHELDHHEPSTSHLSRTNMSNIVHSDLGGNGDKKGVMTTLTQELPFYPTSLSFSDITYTVRVKDLQGNTSDRTLLNGISGYSAPGEMIALMGASGAGKTTLLDVLAGLKNQGVMTGKILFNGVEADKEARGVLTGYVQQFPSLWGFSSVEETLLFAARLRMGKDIPDETKKKVVEEILDVLDLTPIRDFIIGNYMVSGLSPSQLKRVSIGVELVANPSILFLDEPTTGLDSKSAATVLKAIKRVADSGRCIICTIHQPSAELFFFFSRLYLLAPGGHQIFGGDVGYRSRSFVKYYSSIPGVAPIQPRSNPANWMLIESSKIPEDKYISLEHIKANTTILDDNGLDENQYMERLPNQKWTLYLKWYYFHTAIAWYEVAKDLNTVEDIYYTEFPDTPRIERKGPDRLTTKQLEHLQETEKEQQDKAKLASELQQSAEKPVNDEEEGGDNNTTLSNENEADIETKEGLHTPEHPTILTQLMYIFARHFTLYFRNPGQMTNRFLVLLSSSVITGLIYLNFKVTTESTLISAAACIIMVTGNYAFNIANSTPALYISQRPVFYREKAQGFYTYPWIWSLANTLNEFLWCIPLIITCTWPVWLMAGFPSDAGIFFKWWLVAYVTMLTFISAQQFMSAFVPNMSFSQLATSILSAMSFILNGIGITLKILRQVSWFHEALYWILPLGPLNLFLSNAIFDYQPGRTILVVEGSEQISVPLSEFAASFFGYNPSLHWFYFGVLLIQMFVWQTFYHLATTFMDHNKR